MAAMLGVSLEAASKGASLLSPLSSRKRLSVNTLNTVGSWHPIFLSSMLTAFVLRLLIHFQAFVGLNPTLFDLVKVVITILPNAYPKAVVPQVPLVCKANRDIGLSRNPTRA